MPSTTHKTKANVNKGTGIDKSPSDFLVTGLDNVEPAYAEFEGNMYAGLLPSSHDDRVGETMFWLFEPTTQLVENTIVVWLNGGPGCSSFNCGVMMEHSPVTQPLRPAGYCCLVDSTPQLQPNKYAWTKSTTMLYVEHPIGTGFSYGNPLPETEQEASADLDQFLQHFFTVFDKFQDYSFYVMGESYAGMFVPSVARYIHRANEQALKTNNNNNNHNRIHIPLKGAALGNGWIDPKIQGPATIDYSWWHGLIDSPTRDALHTEWSNCMSQDSKSNNINPPPFHPFNVQDDCGIMWGVLQAAGNPNAYDVTTWDPNVDQVTFTSEAFYNRPDVKQYLHAPTNITWHGCRWGEGRRRLEQHTRKLYMDNDRPLSVVPYMAELLNAGIPLLVYNGDRDMTTNMVGTELALNAMTEWNMIDDWLDAKRGLWMTDSYEAGWAKELGPLTFVVVYNSGHMVPYNQPKPGLDLVTRFLTKTSFMDTELPTIRIAATTKHSSIQTLEQNEQQQEQQRQPDKLMMKQVVVEDSNAFDLDHEPSSSSSSSSSMIGMTGGHATVGLILVSMLVGFFMAMFVMKRRGGTRSTNSTNGPYQSVPDAET